LHAATRTKAGAGEALLSAEQRASAERLAGALSWAQIHRLWQLLLKGLTDTDLAPDPQEAATMALLRLIHAADLPDPAALLARLANGDTIAAPAAAAAAGGVPKGPVATLPGSFTALIDLLEAGGKHSLAVQLHDQVGLVRYAPPDLALKPLRPLGADWPRELATILKTLTGATWLVTLSEEPSAPSLLEQDKIAQERVRAEVLADPGVQAVFEAFPGAALESFSKG
jgi:DNA polymerase-3 subunit gamma/tau